MATAFKDLYPDPTLSGGVASHLMSDAILASPRPRMRFIHTVGLPGGLQIETDEPELRDQVKALIDAMIVIKDLPAGWDTYSANTVDPEAFRPALDLALYATQRCHLPRVTAASDGGIILLWEDADRELEIEVAPGGHDLSLLLVDADGQEQEPDGPLSLQAAKGFIDAYCRG